MCIASFFMACKGSDDVSTARGNGKIIQLDSVPSLIVKSRTIEVWTPADYDTIKKYPVIYLLTGQTLDSNNTGSLKDWDVDETMSKLLKDDK